MRPIRATMVTVIVSAATLAATLAACGGGKRVASRIPENVAAEPRGLVGVFAPSADSPLPIALRALGVPFRRLPHADLDDGHLDGLALVVLDEMALDDPLAPGSLPRLLDYARTNTMPLVVLMQSPERGRDVLRSNTAPIEPRRITHGVELVVPDVTHRLVAAPNIVRSEDLEEYSGRTAQFARGRNGRAIIAGNLERPDSSAALLGVSYGRGAVYYVGFPIAARAAEGYESEQRLLANLVSLAR